MEATLEKLFLEKSLGALTLGMHRDDVLRILGQPNHWEDQRKSFMEDELWCYGANQFNFGKRGLSSIMWFYSEPEPEGTTRFVDTTPAQICDHLRFRIWLSERNLP